MKKRTGIVLTGFRATGKTVIGGLVAEKLGYPLIDTDEVICRRHGKTVARIVADDGWACFRKTEKEVLGELVGKERVVVAVGGGAVEHVDIWPLLQKSFVIVWLQADIEVIMQRMTADKKTAQQRPSLTDQTLEKEIGEILKRRQPLYRAGADFVVQSGGATPEEIAAEILSRIPSH